MTTILPQKNKKEIKRQYLVGFLLKVLWVLIIVTLVWLIFEGAIYYATGLEKSVLENQTDAQDQQVKSNLLNTYRADLKEAKEIISLFDQNNRSKVEALDFIFDTKTEGIIINSVSIEKGETVVFVGISALAENREVLAEFKDVLDNSSKTTEVDLPVSSFTKTFDIPFTITFIYKYE
jgi:hypothetical protein